MSSRSRGGPADNDLPDGRIPKIDEQAIENVVKVIQAGNHRCTAAAAIGISAVSFCNWMRKGRLQNSNNPLYRKFFLAVKKAEGEAVQRNIEKILAAGDKNWQALAWWLERKYPELWGSLSLQIRDLEKKVKALEK